MGGSSYDRDVYGGSSSSGWGSFGDSSYSASKLNSSTLDDSMDPQGKTIESHSKQPIIIVLDVTGSNIRFARVVYDKMPMFYGQIEQQGYLDDFDIAFCAVGDAYCDSYPIQIGDFAKGIELDSWLEKLVLEGCGGGQRHESYELMAYYLYKSTTFQPGSEPIIFFIGDEMPYSVVNKSQAKEIGLPCEENVTDVFKLLREKVNDNVFMMLNPYCSENFETDIVECWTSLLAPEHVIKIKEEKGIVDLMLGVISMVSGQRTLDTYTIDMKNRGQTQKRISDVSESLQDLSTAIVPVTISGSIAPTENTRKSTQKGKRI